MNPTQWISEVSRAYHAMGLMFTPTKTDYLLSEYSASDAEVNDEVMIETLGAMTRYFFQKASKGETFGPLGRIKVEFGRSLEENYGVSSGAFLNMAKTYWTYKVEVGDLLHGYENILISQILSQLEVDIASIFFPTPGPSAIPVSKRIKAQQELLKEYAPEIDVADFLNNNPLLHRSFNDTQNFMRAYKNRPVLNGIVFALWLAVIINVIKSFYYLLSSQFEIAGIAFLYVIGFFTLWYVIHTWALKHPKKGSSAESGRGGRW